ncbi:single-stranded DNA-binding protein [bacterium]|nr:single-stranded DNA-binding protein [bacterium]
MINKLILVGNVGAEPEIREFPSGTKKATIRLATNERYKTRSGEERDVTQWHRIICWGKDAEFVEENVKKGRKLYVEGSIEYRQYEDAEGNQKYITEIKAGWPKGKVLVMDDRQEGGFAEMVNKLILVGEAQTKPQMGSSVQGGKEANFTVMTNRITTTRSGDKWEEIHAHTVVCWGKDAEFAEKFINEGTKLFVMGTMNTPAGGNTGKSEAAVVQVAWPEGEIRLMDGRREESRPSTSESTSPSRGKKERIISKTGGDLPVMDVNDLPKTG